MFGAPTARFFLSCGAPNHSLGEKHPHRVVRQTGKPRDMSSSRLRSATAQGSRYRRADGQGAAARGGRGRRRRRRRRLWQLVVVVVAEVVIVVVLHRPGSGHRRRVKERRAVRPAGRRNDNKHTCRSRLTKVWTARGLRRAGWSRLILS